MNSAVAGPARHARIRLPAHRTLLDAATETMAALDWASATLQLLGGPMDQAVFHCAVLTPAGPRWIDYGPARRVAAPAWLVMGSVTFGRTRQGGPALHCHAMLSGPEGLVGGHLAPESCIIGDAGLIAHAVSGPSAGFTIQSDPASGFDLLAPALLSPTLAATA